MTATVIEQMDIRDTPDTPVVPELVADGTVRCFGDVVNWTEEQLSCYPGHDKTARDVQNSIAKDAIEAALFFVNKGEEVVCYLGSQVLKGCK